MISGVPPADGGAAGGAGAGVGVCAKTTELVNAIELVNAMAQTAKVAETMVRICFSQLKPLIYYRSSNLRR
jgi:hypothetical protein